VNKGLIPFSTVKVIVEVGRVVSGMSVWLGIANSLRLVIPHNMITTQGFLAHILLTDLTPFAVFVISHSRNQELGPTPAAPGSPEPGGTSGSGMTLRNEAVNINAIISRTSSQNKTTEVL
jgi:hypothetical protein